MGRAEAHNRECSKESSKGGALESMSVISQHPCRSKPLALSQRIFFAVLGASTQK